MGKESRKIENRESEAIYLERGKWTTRLVSVVSMCVSRIEIRR